MTFSGFPPSAVRLYADLAADNTKDAWRRRHRPVYERDVRAPMDELAAELSDAFAEFAGPDGVRVLGPVRDTRMANDKSPYKTYQGAYLDVLPCLGFWLQLDQDGIYVSGRYYPYDTELVRRYREAVDDEDGGAQLAAITAKLAGRGFTIGGDRLKSRPRGVPADHPRIALLRHRKIDAGRRFPPGPGVHSARAGQLVAESWRHVLPLLDWVRARPGLTPHPGPHSVSPAGRSSEPGSWQTGMSAR